MIASLALGTVTSAFADSKSKATKSKLTEDQKIIHLLNRTGFGARPGDVERVKRIGIDKYLEQQLHPDRIDDSAVEARLKGFDSLHMTIAEIYEKYPQPNMIARELGLGRKGANQQAKSGDPQNPDAQPNAQDQQIDLNKPENRQAIFAYYREHGLKPPQMLLQELMAQKIIRAVYSERQLQEVMTDFWFNHFNIDWRKGGDKWMLTDYEMNHIRPYALGKFKDLLMATAKSPAMMFYLDNFQSMSPDAKLPQRRGIGRQSRFQGRLGLSGQGNQQQQRPQVPPQLRNRKPGINENYARELMELHTLGVDGGYTQRDVQEVARCFTGWTIDQPRRSGQFIFRPFMHDDGEKVVLGHKIPAGGGIKDGEMVIDILAHHPSTARFIATKLVRKFVSDAPPQSLVDKVAGVYMKTDGDIGEMLRAIFTSSEFYSPEAYRAKIKSPFELAVSALRALGGDVQNTMQLAQFIARMGQPLYQYQPPTGYPDRAEQWVNTGALLERLNFGLALSSNRLRGAAVDMSKAAPGVDASNSKAVMDRAIALLLNNEVSPQTRQILDKQLKEGVPVEGELVNKPAAMNRADDTGDAMMVDEGAQARVGTKQKGQLNERRARLLGLNLGNIAPQKPLTPVEAEIAKAFGLVLGSPEFQRR